MRGVPAPSSAKMIIDTHAYCFEAFDATEPGRGWADPAEHLALHRAGNAGHHQPALRLDDGLVGDKAKRRPAAAT